MGRSKFRLSDMIPRAWLRKLRHPGSALSNPRSLLPPPDDYGFRHEPPPHPLSLVNQPHQRKSYHFSRQFDGVHPHHPPNPPKRSTTSKHRRPTHLRRPTRPRRFMSAVSAGCSCRTLADFDPTRTKPECRFPISPSSSPSSTHSVVPHSPPSFGHSSGSVPSSESFDQKISWTTTSSSCRCRADLDDPVMLEEGFDCNPLFELELEFPAVITKPPEFNEMVMNLRRRGENRNPIGPNRHEDSGSNLDTSTVLANVVEKETYNRTARGNREQKKPPRPIVSTASSPAGGMRMRVNSPKLATRKPNQAHLQGRKSANTLVSSRPGKNLGYKAMKSSISEGLAVVKTSVDPWKDFRESMEEMIVENDIRGLKDLEELLARYLMLNSDEYHDLIVRVFKQIWFEFYSAQSK